MVTVADPASVELGVKFRAAVSGEVLGLRFYKGPQNTGAHTGRLWSSSGALLGTLTFTNESASGWQEARFAAPIPVTAGATYVASYFAPVGRYSADPNYFVASHAVFWAATGETRDPCRAQARCQRQHGFRFDA